MKYFRSTAKILGKSGFVAKTQFLSINDIKNTVVQHSLNVLHAEKKKRVYLRGFKSFNVLIRIWPNLIGYSENCTIRNLFYNSVSYQKLLHTIFQTFSKRPFLFLKSFYTKVLLLWFHIYYRVPNRKTTQIKYSIFTVICRLYSVFFSLLKNGV